MKAFTKTVNPYMIRKPDQEPPYRWLNCFFDIKFDNKGRFSISGVEGPYSNGDCLGSCGQVSKPENWKEYKKSPGWDKRKIDKFFDLWDQWHLNDMRPYSAEMKAAGWHEKAKTEMLGYQFSRTHAVFKAEDMARKAAIDAARRGETFTPTAEQVKALNVKELAKFGFTPANRNRKRPKGTNEPTIQLSTSREPVRSRPKERLSVGSIPPSKGPVFGSDDHHPDGLLTRKLHPGDEEGIWRRMGNSEQVPESVLQWFLDLPDANRKISVGKMSGGNSTPGEGDRFLFIGICWLIGLMLAVVRNDAETFYSVALFSVVLAYV